MQEAQFKAMYKLILDQTVNLCHSSLKQSVSQITPPGVKSTIKKYFVGKTNFI